MKCRNWICIQKFNFHWTSELAWIWHLLHWQHFDKTYFKLMVVQLFLKTQKRQFCNQTLPEQERLKSANCSQKMPNHVNFDVQEKNWILFTNSNSTLQVCMKFVFIVTFSVFLDSEWITYNVRVFPNPEFMSVKVQNETFLKKDSRDFINSFYLGFLWIPSKPGKQN